MKRSGTRERKIAADFRAAFPDPEWTVDLILAEGDLVAGALDRQGYEHGAVGRRRTLWFELFTTPPLAAEAPELSESELGLVGFILVFFAGALGWLLFGVANLLG